MTRERSLSIPLPWTVTLTLIVREPVPWFLQSDRGERLKRNDWHHRIACRGGSWRRCCAGARHFPCVSRLGACTGRRQFSCVAWVPTHFSLSTVRFTVGRDWQRVVGNFCGCVASECSCSSFYNQTMCFCRECDSIAVSDVVDRRGKWLLTGVAVCSSAAAISCRRVCNGHSRHWVDRGLSDCRGPCTVVLRDRSCGVPLPL